MYDWRTEGIEVSRVGINSGNIIEPNQDADVTSIPYNQKQHCIETTLRMLSSHVLLGTKLNIGSICYNMLLIKQSIFSTESPTLQMALKLYT